jgi:hypothetical protein
MARWRELEAWNRAVSQSLPHEVRRKLPPKKIELALGETPAYCDERAALTDSQPWAQDAWTFQQFDFRKTRK